MQINLKTYNISMYVVEGHKNAEQICSTIVTKTTKQAKVGRFEENSSTRKATL